VVLELPCSSDSKLDGGDKPQQQQQVSAPPPDSAKTTQSSPRNLPVKPRPELQHLQPTKSPPSPQNSPFQQRRLQQQQQQQKPQPQQSPQKQQPTPQKQQSQQPPQKPLYQLPGGGAVFQGPKVSSSKPVLGTSPRVVTTNTDSTTPRKGEIRYANGDYYKGSIKGNKRGKWMNDS